MRFKSPAQRQLDLVNESMERQAQLMTAYRDTLQKLE
jgi:hypothetical protein